MKRSRSRPTKSCEECRRKKLKCDRELPCANCKKGGRDGSICFFKSGLDEKESKRVRVDDGERERRPYGGVGVVSYEREKGNYPNVPALGRSDPIGPGRGLLAYGMADVGSDSRVGNGEIDYASDPKPDCRGIVRFGTEFETGLSGSGSAERYPNVPAVAREDNIGFGRGMFTYGVNDVSAGGPKRDDLPTPMSSGGLGPEVAARALGRVHVKKTRSRYVGPWDRMATLDHVRFSPHE